MITELSFCTNFQSDDNSILITFPCTQNDGAYRAVHRIAVAEGCHGKGVADICFDFALSFCGNVKIDTHRDNIPMQKALSKYGFRHCGTVYVRDRSPRLAFEYTGEENSPPSLTL